MECLRINPSASMGVEPLVFLHEGLGSVAMWRNFPQLLCAATGRAGLVYSRRGYGQSESIADVRGAGRLQPDYMHREAFDVLPELLRKEGVARPVLVGHSDGGTIALLFASKFPTTACIVMAPHLFVEDISLRAISQAREAFMRGDLRERLAKYHADPDCAFWQWNDIWLSPAFRSFNIEAECEQIACALLAIQGTEDAYGSMAQMDALCKMPNDRNASHQRVFLSEKEPLPANHLRRALLKLERCGHSPHRDHPQRVITAITDWLAQPAQALGSLSPD